MPEGEIDVETFESNTTKTIMHFQYAGINRDDPNLDTKHRTMFTYLAKHGIDGNQYMSWACLRAGQHYKNEKFKVNKFVTESVYVHSKLMIVDDQHVIIGSANLNDRSQEGDRDSEVCLYFNDASGAFPKSLRHQLWSTFMGVSQDTIASLSPNSDEMYQLWNSTKLENSERFDTLFKCIPNNQIHSYDSLKKYWGGFGSYFGANFRAFLSQICGIKLVSKTPKYLLFMLAKNVRKR